ncbi:hypothetical protein [Streptomyces sp. NPDC102437]|uniref:hypothetical protein n=1 Tax=Streptomyces sp. NPDC102437 TaxID=3366175 RepID=UPI00382168FF
MQGQTISLPSVLSGASNSFLFTLIAPIPLCAALTESLDSRMSPPEASGLRNISLLDAGLSLLSAGIAAASALGMSVALDAPSVSAVGRNVAFLIGLTLLSRSVVGRPAAMVPVAWIFCVVFFGYKNSQQSYFWAILPEGSNDPYAAAAAAIALSAGLAAQIFWPPHSNETTGEAWN